MRDQASVLAGDRHLQVAGERIKPGLFVIPPNLPLSWSRELHPSFQKGNVLFADGHAEFTKSLTIALRRSGPGTNRLAVP